MFDKHINKIVDKPLQAIALELAKINITANQLTIIGFILGFLSFVQIAYGNFFLGLFFLLLNRFFDGLDGRLANISSPTNSGAFLDIVFDFIFYAIIPLGFGISLPEARMAALTLIFSFVATGTTFLAFSIMAEKYQLKNIHYPNKSFYYLGGITEGSETIFFFILFCIFPQWFIFLAYSFSFLCFFTAAFRMVYGFKTLKQKEKRDKDSKRKIYNNIL